MNTTSIPGSTGNANTGASSGVTVLSLDDLNRQRQLLSEQQKMLDEQEAVLRRQAEEASRAKVAALPDYLGVTNLNDVLNLIRSVQRGSPKTVSGRARGTPIPTDIKEAVARALKAGASVPSCSKRFKISTAWLSSYKRKLGLVGKNKGRINISDIPAEKLAA